MSYSGSITNQKIQNILDLCSDVESITKELYSKTPISFLHYFKTFPNGRYITLSNNPKWLEYYFQNNLFQHSSFLNKPSTYSEGIVLTAQLKPSVKIVHVAHDHNIGDGVVLIKPGSDYCEFFLFCCPSGFDNANQFFINHLDMLNNFICLFQDSAKPIIDLSSKNILIASNIKQMENQLNYKKYNPNFEIQRHYLNKNAYLTKREIEIIRHIAHGKTANDISNELSISKRTAEKHIQNAKEKIGINSSIELISFAVKHKLFVPA